MKRILIADDEPHIVRILKLIMERGNYQIITASNGEEAYQTALKEHPDLIFLDIMMPKIDGNRVCRMLREEKNLKDIPIIMLTGKGLEGDKEMGLSAGATCYITKPFSPKEMLDLVKELIGN
jgi:DNA-binding response OmpR family regulator